MSIGDGLRKVSKKKALAQLLCDMVGVSMLSPEEAESARACVSTRLVNIGNTRPRPSPSDSAAGPVWRPGTAA